MGVYAYIHIYMYIYMYIFIRVCQYKYIHGYIHIYICIYACIPVYMVMGSVRGRGDPELKPADPRAFLCRNPSTSSLCQCADQRCSYC